jgi:ribosomal protein S5
MKGNQGRRRRLSVMVVTGNMQGLAGFATAKAVETKAAIRKAKNRAGQKLMHIELYNNHTGMAQIIKMQVYISHIFIVFTSSISQFLHTVWQNKNICQQST